MRLSSLRWTLILLALPLARCAQGEEPPDAPDAGRSGSFSIGGSGGSGGRFAAGGNPVFAGSSSGGKASGGSSGSPGISGNPGTSGTGGGSGNCTDELKSLGETDVDCGGATCDPCAEGLVCKADGDCVSGQCVGLTCAPDHCGDAMVNEDESDEDCGGSCKPCKIDQACNEPTDCEGRNCMDGTCAMPMHCVAGWEDEMETCGAPCRGAMQDDQRACAEVLQCYIDNDCGPDECGGGQQPCSVNTLALGTAPFPIALQVYMCMCMP